ncbi:OVARIAN TUMOR DOMAIN-containing deubiquitinating enzyme 4-like [Rutidosis leptorrhynchoides]|uniref:OVARIAN TUMOR DOMAIN-containing deubiquitinating enzyme 4-like n=1 Tax=Rutidosis leptorrhynchoides TaxID=125765 RepID=UPI003A98D4EC
MQRRRRRRKLKKEDVCNSTSEPVPAEVITNFSNAKQVHTDYSVIGIPGDGRCLFRAVAHGAFLRSWKVAPSESLQRDLADELRAKVADEFVKRREEMER